ncbi:NACHT domain-containing protein [Williamsia soli]|uniref:NACHT domain-containing protein n=1 Tax=Williamsia soli TaxID=364929 RepID=UPI001A9CD7FA|nr:hypothetical protein [Williamsia soli]
MQYDYERFTPDRFQEFCQALLSRDYPALQCYPVGQKDGGRDGLSRQGPSDCIVFQVKFKRERFTNDDPHKILTEAIKKEIPKIEILKERGASQYIILTNLAGSSALDAGAMDKTQRYVDENVPIPCKIWWRNDIDARLNNAYDLKWIFSEILTSADVLRRLIEDGLGESSHRRLLAVTGYLTAQYEIDEYVKFKQADLQSSALLSLFIDVPIGHGVFHTRGTRNNDAVDETFSQVIEDEMSGGSHSVHGRYEVGGATLLLHPAAQSGLSRVVIEGAPGQGKSTLAQYVCQVQRMKFLGKTQLDQVPAKHRLVPARIPFKVDLRDFSLWLQRIDPISGTEVDPSSTPSLESFLARQISHLSGGQSFTVDDLLLVFSTTSTLIFLDGLDEVAALTDRRTVVEAAMSAGNRLAATAPRTQMVVTSRPAAVANSPRFSSESWVYLTLNSINEDLVFEYTDRWSRARKISQFDIDEMKRVLRTKLSRAHIRDLARNAMQLTILLNLVHIRGQALPDHRTELYDSYIDVFFNREADKNKAVLENRQLLIDLHGFLAWKIHSSAESRGNGGRVTDEALRSMIENFLTSREHDTGVLDDLVTGVVQRIVALVSRVEGTFEFEVQPLREYFAARHLYNTAPYSPVGNPKKGTKLEIFDAIAPSGYWLNVTRFYAGCYSVGELAGLASQVVDLIETGNGAKSSFPRAVATSLLSDRVFHQAPRLTRQVASHTIDGLALRYAFHRRFVTDNSVELMLPDDCGLDTAVKALVERCHSLPSRAARREAGFLLAYIAPDAVRFKAWRDSMPSLTETDDLAFERWLEVGLDTRSVSSLENSLARKIASRSPDIWANFVLGGHPAVLSSAEEQLTATREAADCNFAFEWVGGPLTPVSRALNIYSFSFFRPGSSYIFEDIDEKVKDSIVVEPKLRTMVSEISDLTSRSRRRSYVDTPAPWMSALQSFEKALGRTWLSWKLASLALGRISTSYKKVDDTEATDPISIAFKALNHRAETDWWRDQHEHSETLPKSAWLMLLLQVATPAVLRNLAMLSLQVCDTQSSTSFRLIFNAIAKAPGSSIPTKIANVILDAVDSPRLHFSIAVRSTYAIRVRAMRSITSLQLETDPVLANIALEWIHSSPPSGDSGEVWESYLKDIARFFASSDDPYVGLQPNALARMPKEAANRVLADPDRYPSSLLHAADQTISAAHQRSISTVGAIAKREKWLANG